MTSRLSPLLAALALAATPAAAQPQPQPQPPAGKADAKQLMQTGVRLLEAKDYLGALAIFKEAYERFASAKILLNIGTTLTLLDRKAEAANAYQHYLDSADNDPAKRPEVSDALADLDKSLGRVKVTLDPADSELEIDGDWRKGARVIHVAPGDFTLHARRDGYQPADRQVSTAAGQQVETVIALAIIPKPTVKTEIITVPRDEGPISDELGPRARFGAIAMAHVSVVPRVGSAWMIGATADVTEQLAIDAGVLLGPGLVSKDSSYMYSPPSFGGYLGASFAFMTGHWRPRASAGFPVFFSDGARIAIRAAGGVEYVATKHLSFVLELGVEQNLNPQSDIDNTALVPALAASGRL